MEHTRILAVDKGTSNLYVEYDDSLPITTRKIKINVDGTYDELPTDELAYKDIFWLSEITIPEENCYLLIIIMRDNVIVDYIINRVGEPDLKIFYTDPSIQETKIITYKQYSKDGVLLANDNLTYLLEGVFYYEPVNQFESFIKFNDSLAKILKLPYIIIPISSGGDIDGDGLFLDTGFSTYGFIGNKNSYFDIESGAWVEDESRIAKASDLAKAIAYKYNLDWDDRTSDNHIYKVINYLRTYDEEAKAFRLYAPAVTPENNKANFDLITTDELGNTFVKGISMLLVRDLETIEEGSSGVIIPFK